MRPMSGRNLPRGAAGAAAAAPVGAAPTIASLAVTSFIELAALHAVRGVARQCAAHGAKTIGRSATQIGRHLVSARALMYTTATSARFEPNCPAHKRVSERPP